MKRYDRILPWALTAAAAFLIVMVPCAVPAAAQMRTTAARQTAAPPASQNAGDLQAQLLKLLRLSPTLTTVVAHDPTLLADQDYVKRNNPELAEFLAAHPEIVRNPEFYLFTSLSDADGHRDQALERAVWPDLVPPERPEPVSPRIVNDIVPMVVVPAIFAAFVLMLKLFLESRRSSRYFAMQSQIHAQLINKFTSSQDLAAYLESEAGRKLLEAAPLTSSPERSQRVPNAVARVLTPLQVGIVLVLLGAGLLVLRHAGAEMQTPMLVLGTIAIMPGFGFILSAGVTWVLAGRLGLLPQANQSSASSVSQDRL